MYNKLFTKILDSSIWLESMPTRIVWFTFIAVMDETGFCQFAAVANLAHRDRVSLEQAQKAVACLEAPDPNSSDPEHKGRRIERVPGGWIVLNAEKHRAMVTRQVVREQTRERVRKHRARNAPVTQSTVHVTPSEVLSESESGKKNQSRTTFQVLRKIAYTIGARTKPLDGTFKEDLKVAAAKAGIAYDADVIRKVLDALEHQEKRKRPP